MLSSSRRKGGLRLRCAVCTIRWADEAAGAVTKGWQTQELQGSAKEVIGRDCFPSPGRATAKAMEAKCGLYAHDFAREMLAISLTEGGADGPFHVALVALRRSWGGELPFGEKATVLRSSKSSSSSSSRESISLHLVIVSATARAREEGFG